MGCRFVEEKFEKYFGYLARCEEDFGTYTLQNQNFGSKFDENAKIDSAEICNFDFGKIGIRENEKSAPQIRFRF